ncbi:Ig-like domain-containing protein [Sporocytophaga myxococcoides]|uniref:Ig-like domain-containing protein n=1 Tax=Sporocytophaga myxococcoides TaxID=153721 RepID=UPI003CCBA79D
MKSLKRSCDGSLITIDANFNSTEISNLQYYNGNSLIGQNEQQPYSYNLTHLPTCSYKI